MKQLFDPKSESICRITFTPEELSDTIISRREIAFPCFSDKLLLTSTHPGSSVLWSNGDTAREIIISGAGVYTVGYRNGCSYHKDVYTTYKSSQAMLPKIHTS